MAGVLLLLVLSLGCLGPGLLSVVTGGITAMFVSERLKHRSEDLAGVAFGVILYSSIAFGIWASWTYLMWLSQHAPPLPDECYQGPCEELKPWYIP